MGKKKDNKKEQTSAAKRYVEFTYLQTALVRDMSLALVILRIGEEYWISVSVWKREM